MRLAVFEQWEVQKCGPPGCGELRVQPVVDRHFPEPSPGGSCVPTQDQRGGEVGDGGAHNFCGDVQEEDEQGS